VNTRDGITWERFGIQSGLTSIVVLTLNELEHTKRCVASIERHTPEAHELIFVDNGSTDGTLEYLRSLDAVTVIANRTNHGFGGGCNQGMAVARGDRVLLLNNDTVVTAGWLDAMNRAMDSRPNCGMVGPMSNRVAGEQQIDVAYDVATLEGLEQFAAERAARNSGSGMVLPRLIGFCLLLDRSVIDAVGGFDVGYGIGNFEDDDLCIRAGVYGFEAWACADAYVHHVGSQTFTGTGTDWSATMERNWTRFAERWGLPVGKGVAAAYDAAGLLQRNSYDPRTHYMPLVAEPRNDREAHIEGRSLSLFVPADADDLASFEATVRMCLQSHTDDGWATLVIRMERRGEALLHAALERAANAVHGELPDIVLIVDDALNDEAVVEACTAVVCHGRRAAMYDGLAHHIGRMVMLVEPSPDDRPSNVMPLRVVA
jgi:GT2 family glycosyltransferase